MGILRHTQQQYYQGTDQGNYQFITLEEVINLMWGKDNEQRI